MPRHLVDYVVTEYGIAMSLGKNQRERAEELINIAHPDLFNILYPLITGS